MVKGAVLRYADGSKLEGDVFGWIEILQCLSVPDFFFQAPHPFANVMNDVSPFELAQVVDYAIKKHRKDIRKLKDVERDCQALEIVCMVQQSYLAGAREMFVEGLKLGLVPNDIEKEVRGKLKDRWILLWRQAAGQAYNILARINQNVHAKGRKAHPLRTSDVASLIGRTDDAVLDNIHARATPDVALASKQYADHMYAGIVPEVKRFIREGKLTSGLRDDDFQYHVDKHAKRIRDRFAAYQNRFTQKAKM